MQLKRVAVVACVFAVVACTTYGEEDKSIDPPKDANDASTDSAVADAPSPVDADLGESGAMDAGSGDATIPPPCTKTPNGGNCTTKDTCCSDKCNEARVCAADCRGSGGTCDPLAVAPCCVGFYCGTVFCAPCIAPGGTPANNGAGALNAKSCCSRTILGNGKCQ